MPHYLAPLIERPVVDSAIAADLTYLVDDGTKPEILVTAPGQGAPARKGSFLAQPVLIEDARGLDPAASLDREGFALVGHQTRVKNFYDVAEIEAVYYPEVEALLKKATGAERVVIFDHNVRIDDGAKAAALGLRNPVQVVHNDYTLRSGPQRLEDLLGPEEAAGLRQNRYAIVNVWRPIVGPVETAPLALADARSVEPKDLVASDLIYPDRVGEIYQVAYNPTHRWYYFPQLKVEEAILIKGYDSAADGRARFVPHTAFLDPTTRPEARPRESIEVRTLVFFGAKDDGGE